MEKANSDLLWSGNCPEGTKADGGKPRWSLLPLKEVEAMVRVLTIGATKYSDDNWKSVPGGKERYYDALMRHIVAWVNGEKEDGETGESHLAHAGCCLLFLHYLDNNQKQAALDTEDSTIMSKTHRAAGPKFKVIRPDLEKNRRLCRQKIDPKDYEDHDVDDNYDYDSPSAEHDVEAISWRG